MKTNTLASKAVLIRLSAGAFIGAPRDKVLTAELEAAHNTAAKVLSVRKKIMQGAELNLCAAKLQELRATFERLSAPWLDGGLRIVAAREIVNVKTKMEETRRIYLAAVDAFCSKRDEIMQRDNSPTRLNGAFRASDYPSESELRAKFYADLEILPVPADFRTEGIDASLAREIQSAADAMTENRLKAAKTDLLARVAERLGELSAKLAKFKPSDKTGRFHDASVTNIAETCAQVRAANFDDDKAVERIVSKVEKAVAKLSPDGIKANDSEAADAKETAEKLLADVTASMAAFA